MQSREPSQVVSLTSDTWVLSKLQQYCQSKRGTQRPPQGGTKRDWLPGLWAWQAVLPMLGLQQFMSLELATEGLAAESHYHGLTVALVFSRMFL